MLACARIGAPHNVVFGGFSRRVGPRADGVLRGQGADHRRRRARARARRRRSRRAVDEVMGRPGVARAHRRRALQGHRLRDDGRAATCSTTRSSSAADAECPAEPMDAEDPLFILYTSGSTAKPKGILHTTGGYLTGVSATHRYVFDLHPETDVYWCSADVGWVTGHSYIVYGPLGNGATSVMYEGAPDYPHKGIWWELCRALQGDDLLHRADGDPRLHQVGRRAPGQVRPSSSLRLLGIGRRADQPQGVALVPQGDRRRALPDRRHLVADRDRRDHDHAAARASPRPSPARRRSRSPGSRPRSSTSARASRSTRARACSCSPGRGRRCCARSTRTTSASSRPTSSASASETYLVGDAARKDADGYFWVIGRIDDVVNVSGHRLSTAEVESAIVAHDRRRRGGGDRPDRRGHRSGDLRVRHPPGRPRGHRRGRRGRSARRSPSGSASSPARSGSSGPTTCRRPARARSCAACCATSPRAARSAT